MQRTLGEAGQLRPGDARTAASGSACARRSEPSVLPPLGRALCAAGPRLTLAAARHDRPRLEQDLAAGEFDVALDVLLPIADRVPHERVLVDRLIVVARKDHPALRQALRRGAWNLDAYLALRARPGVVATARTDARGHGPASARPHAPRARALPEPRSGLRASRPAPTSSRRFPRRTRGTCIDQDVHIACCRCRSRAWRSRPTCTGRRTPQPTPPTAGSASRCGAR